METFDVFTSSEELWNDTFFQKQKRGMYIAVSGNTGAGKSSLIRAIIKLAYEKDQKIIAVSERSLHHPYLRLMFSKPEEFAFPVQLNFMLQRHMVFLRHLSHGNTVVIERSHLEDDLFVREHVLEKKITGEQYKAYQTLAKVLHAKIPMPDVIALFNISPEISYERLELSEKSNDRPLEFPNDEDKKAWVYRWNKLYREFHNELRQRCTTDPTFNHTRLLEIDTTRSTQNIAGEIFDIICKYHEQKSK